MVAGRLLSVAGAYIGRHRVRDNKLARMTGDIGGKKTVAVLAILVLAQPGPAAGTCPSAALRVSPGADLASLVRHAPSGTAFCLRPGIYRLAEIIPKDGDSFFGEPGAVLNGSRVVDEFEQEGSHWVARGLVKHAMVMPRVSVPCIPDMPRCTQGDAVFIDNTPMLSVGSLDQLQPGRFFLDYGNGDLYLANDPRSHVIEAAISRYAFKAGARGVVIRGLTVEKYASPAQLGAIGYGFAPRNWLVEDNDVRLNASDGVVVGTDSRIIHNRIHHNGEMGIGCVGDNILIQENEISFNGYFAGIDPKWEGGGGKCANTNGLTVRSNASFENNGNGFWTDINNDRTLYEYNEFKNNKMSGLAHEISRRAVIRYNRFFGNGDSPHVWLWHAAILVQNSREVEAYGNTVICALGNGISLIQQNRTDNNRLWPTINNYVHDNRVVATVPGACASGSVADYNPYGMLAGNNRFDHNSYVMADSNGYHWAWVARFYNWADYRSQTGQDSASTLTVRLPPLGERPANQPHAPSQRASP